MVLIFACNNFRVFPECLQKKSRISIIREIFISERKKGNFIHTSKKWNSIAKFLIKDY